MTSEIELRYIDNNAGLNDLIKAVQSGDEFGFDVEASSLDPIAGVLLLVQIFDGSTAFVINAGKIDKSIMTYVFKLINDSNKVLIGHNVKFDMKYIKAKYGVMPTHVYDTQVAHTLTRAGLIDPFNRLDTLLDKYLNVKIGKDIRDQFINKTDFEFTKEQIEYAATDVCFMPQLKHLIDVQIDKVGMRKTLELEMRTLPPTASMEYNGFLIDQEKWRENIAVSRELTESRRVDLLNYIANHFEVISPNPSNAVEAYENFCIPVPKTVKGRTRLEGIVTREEIVSEILQKVNFNSSYQMKRAVNAFGVEEDSTNKKILEKYKDNGFVSRLLLYREYLKDETTYGESFLAKISDDGRIRPSFNQHKPASGRYSSSDPNLQNIKRGNSYRECFISREGYSILTADYSQIELRTGAVMAGEWVMIKAFNEGLDLHALTASAIYNKPVEDIVSDERSVGKTLNFAVVYGTTARGLQFNFGIPEKDGERYLASFFNNYKHLAYFIKEAGNTIINKGYSITANGRKRFFTVPTNFSKRDIRDLLKIKRQGVNHIIQGTSADMIKIAICNIYYGNPFGDGLMLVSTVHDEIVLEIKDDIVEEATKFVIEQMVKAGDVFLKGIVETKVDFAVKPHWSK